MIPLFSIIVNLPLFLVLKIKAGLFKNKSALLWYEDAANFPNLTFFQLLAERPYYREILYYRCSGIAVAILRRLYPSYTHWSVGHPRKLSLGGGVYLDHPYCTVLNAKKIGRNFKIKHMITIGNANGGIPTIGNNVSIGCGAVVVGDIVVGDNVNIGANCVIVKNVPSNCTVVGNPAYIVKLNGERVNVKL